MHSIRTRITAVTVIAIIVTILAAAAAGFFTVGTEVTTSSAEKMHLMSEVTQKSLDSYLNDIEQAVRIGAQIGTNSLDGMRLVECGANKKPSERTSAQTEELDAYLAEHTNYVKSSFGDVSNNTKGVMSYYYCLAPDISENELGFFYSRRGKIGFEETGPIDVSLLNPQDLEHNIWYFQPVEQGIPCWVGPYKSIYLHDAPIISYVTPIYRSGVFVGVMGMDILMSTLTEQINSLQVYSTGYACLLDDQGNMIYHPKYDLDSIPASESQVYNRNTFIKADSGDEAIIYDKNGEQWQMSYSTLLNGMKLVVTAPICEVSSSWYSLLNIVPLIGAVILALFIPATLIGMGAVTKPLRQLTDAAHRLSGGNYDIELDYHGNDEVGELTDAFRHLRDHLQVYTSNLSSASFSDKLTGVKNCDAFKMYAAQVNDTVAHAVESDERLYALAVIDCMNLDRVREDFGAKWVDASVKTTCKLICDVYSAASVYRVSEQRFVVFLQGRNYANREELFCDFDILASEINAAATEPWLQIQVAKGMATYRAGQDKDVSAVLARAIRRTEQA